MRAIVRRRAAFVSICGVLVTTVGLRVVPTPDTVAEAAMPAVHIEAGRVCLTGLTPAHLDTLFDTEPGGVVGADYQRAFALSDGRVLWTFQDAAVRLAPDVITIVHNIAVLQDGLCFTVLYGGTRSQPTPFFFASRTVPYQRWFWPMDATVGTDGRIYVYAAEMEERGSDYLTHAVPVGTWVAVVDPATLAVAAEVRPPNASADLYGWSITNDDQWTYLYAQCFRQFGFDLYAGVAAFDRSCAARVTVARVPLGDLFATPAYWDGSGWRADPRRAIPVIDTAGRRINADQIEWTGARFVSVNKEGDWWGDTILLSAADRAEGPFRVYDSVAARVKCPECNTFFANWVPAAAVGRTDRSFVISLAHNRWDGVITSLYRPTFHRVAAPKFAPAGKTFAFMVAKDAVAVLNVVAVEPTAAGYLTLYPCDRGVPATSNVNHVREPLVSNLVIVRPDATGRVCVFTKATTDVVVDLAGTFAGHSPSSFAPLESASRLADTRQRPGGTPLGAGEVLRVEVPGASGGSSVVNVVAVEHEAPGYLTVYPCDRPRPGTSSVNYVHEPIVSNLVITATDDTGAFCVFTLSRTHVVVDLAGSFASDDSFVAANDVRLVDTRLPGPPARLAAGATVAVEVPAVGPGVALNVVAVEPSAAGYLTVYPCDIARPVTSSVNFASAPIVANLVVLRPSTDGKVCIFASAATDVVVDLVGGIASSSGFVPVDVPERLVDSRTGRGLPGQLGTGR